MSNDKTYRYDIFKTQWGWFGVLGCETGIVRTHLPASHKEAVQRRLLDGFENVKRDKKAFSALKKTITNYYKGLPADFKDIKVCFDGFSEFQEKVLITLRRVKFGKITTYGELARLSGSPRGGRAVGTVLAQNPVPLIIPCHRVIKADGECGHFSGPGGTHTKERMLTLENKKR